MLQGGNKRKPDHQQPSISALSSKRARGDGGVSTPSELASLPGGTQPLGVQEEPPSRLQASAVPADKRSRKFAKKWLDKFTWLRYDELADCMYCALCKKHNRTGPWVSGTDNFRRKTLLCHLTTQDHRLSLSAQDAAQTSLKTSTNSKKFVQTHMLGAIAGLKTVHFIVMEELPNSKFKSLQAWGRHMGAPDLPFLRRGDDPTSTHDSPTAFNEVCF